MDNKKNLSLTISIKSPEGTFFEGEADALSSVNERGIFDILPLHANFISLVKQTLVVHKENKKIREIKIDSGVLRVLENKVLVFLGIETLQEENKKAM